MYFTSIFEAFEVYQDAFQILIDKYHRFCPAMELVKRGYDSVINDLKRKNQLETTKQIAIQKSMASLNSNLQMRQQKFDEKKQRFKKLLGTENQLINDLSEEIIELKDKIVKERAEYKASFAAATYNQSILTNLRNKVDNLKKLKKEYTDYIKNNTGYRAQLEIDAKNAQINLSNVLESISNSRIGIKRTQTNIHALILEIGELDDKIKQKNDFLVQKAEEMKVLGNEIAIIKNNTIDTRNAFSSFSNEIAIALKNAGIAERQIQMIGEDPVKLVALAISFKEGYKQGIDPNLFPHLV